ncbi:hypothetical protein CR513_21117, partial [Mucuna pruriens]
MYSLRQGDLVVTAYFTKLGILWDKLCNFCPFPESNCCNLSKTMQNYQRQLQVGILPKPTILATASKPVNNVVAAQSTDDSINSNYYSREITHFVSSPSSIKPTATAHTNLISTHNVTTRTSSSNSLAPWIIDSGATDHIFSSLQILTSYQSIKFKPILVGLPNDNMLLPH